MIIYETEFKNIKKEKSQTSPLFFMVFQWLNPTSKDNAFSILPYNL